MGETLPAAVLRDRIPLREKGERLQSSAAERASGVLASRLALLASRGHEPEHLTFMVPQATQNLARYLAVSLLMADFVHREGSRVPEDEKGALLEGDVLLVTQRIRRCTDLLQGLCVASLPLADYWQIEVLSKYTRSRTNKPRVFVANPGWRMPEGAAQRGRFGCAIVDASHPRTAAHLAGVLGQPAVRGAPLQVMVVPPWDERRLGVLEPGSSGKATFRRWAWDPAAETAVERAAPPSGTGGATETGVRRPIPDRTVWVCDDQAVDEALRRAHELLSGAARVGAGGGGSTPRAVLGAWSVYHRLRQQAVPMLQAEEERRRAYGTPTMAERLTALQATEVSAAGALGAYLDANWPAVVEVLKFIYDMLLERSEPAKFYTVGHVVEEHLSKHPDERGEPGAPLRIVAPTDYEGTLLGALLGDLVDGFAEAMESGAVALSNVREEARLVAEDQPAQTVLLGFRTGESRHLDVYPSVPVHVVCYPYEAALDEAYQRHSHATIEELQADSRRSETLRRILPVAGRVLEEPTQAAAADGVAGSSAVEAPVTPRPQLKRRTDSVTGARVVRSSEETPVEPLDLSGLWGPSWTDEPGLGEAVDAASGGGAGESRTGISRVEIADEEGERAVYSQDEPLDVYYPATERLERMVARDVRAGMLLVVLVDDRYEALFGRLLEALEEQRPLEESLALKLWRHAKQAALMRHGGNRTQLFEALRRQGFSVDYPALRSYFAEAEDETLAPLKFENFELLARESGIYSDPARLRFTFWCIQNERGARRGGGRLLRSLLRQLAGGEHYQAALASAGVLGTPVEHVAAAVELREVAEVRRLGEGTGQ